MSAGALLLRAKRGSEPIRGVAHTVDTSLSVSSGNLEIIERGYEAMSRLDAEAMVAVSDPDCELRSRIGAAEDVTYRGHDGIRDYIASMSEVFEWVRTEPLDVIEEGDRAVVCNRFRARGRRSGVEMEARFFHAIRFRDRKVRWSVFYPSKAEALEAVGLKAMSRGKGGGSHAR